MKVLDRDYLLQILSPQFIVRDGCVFFEPHFSEATYQAHWQKLALKNPTKVEATLNHIHLSDLTPHLKEQRELGIKIQGVWEGQLRAHFPERQFELKLTENLLDSETEVTLELWMVRNSLKLNRKMNPVR